MNDWRTRYNRERFNHNQGERFLLAKREGERLNKEARKRIEERKRKLSKEN